MNKQRQIIVVVAVFVIAIASLGTIIGLMVNAGQTSDYSAGFSYTLDGSRATITGYDGSDTDVVIPDRIRGNRVVAISSGAFDEKASSITSIEFASTVQGFELGQGVFKNLTSLTKVILPVGLEEVPDSAFEGCKSLKTVVMPDGITKIGSKAFYNCTSLKFIYKSESIADDANDDMIYLPESLLEISDEAFYGCTTIAGLSINKSLEKIGNSAFSGCTRLSNVVVADNSELTSIGESAFYSTIINSQESTPIKFPSLISIGKNAFASIKNNFKYFEFASTVKTIGEGAFSGSTALAKVVFADGIEIETMGDGVFEDATSLSNITLPENLTTIPARTFKGCTRLLSSNSFVIGKNVESIGDGAFAIYTNSASYASKLITVDEGNEYFKTIELESFKKEGSTVSSYSHGLLTSADGAEVYAYFGSYDETSYNSMGKTFRFLDTNGNTIKDIKNIHAYAFAGVEFENILLPITTKSLGSYVFFGSSVVNCYIASIDWEWESDTFIVEDEGKPAINVGILTSAGGDIDSFISKLLDSVLGANKASDSSMP